MAARFCPYCKTSLTPGNINLEQTMAICSTCHNLFQFTTAKGGCSMVQPIGVPPAELPKGMDMTDGSSELVVRRWLWTPRSLPLIAFALLWTLLTLAVLIVGRDVLASVWPATVGVMSLIAVGLLFLASVRIFNREVLRVSSDRVRVKPEPLPSRGLQSFKADDVMQVLAEQVETEQKDGEIVITYELRVALRDDSVHTIVTSLETPEQALYVEQQIEARLPIKRLAGKHADEVGRAAR